MEEEEPTPPQRFGIPQEPEPEPEPQNDSSRYFDEMSQIQNNSGPALTAYKQALSQMPMQKDYEPSMKRRIVSALAGGAIAYNDPREGYARAKEVQDAPYSDAMRDYKTKISGLGEQADIEQKNTNSQLLMLQNARAMGLKYDEFKLKRLETESKMHNDTTTANAALTRAQAYAKAQSKPGYEFSPQQDGSVLAIDKTNPQSTYTIPANTVAAGQLGVSKRTAAVGERNAATNAKNAETNVRRANTSDRAERDSNFRGIVGLGIAQERAANSRPVSPASQQKAEDMALDEMGSDPLMSRFIVKDDKGFSTIAQEPDESDPDYEDYQDFLDALDAKSGEILSGHHSRGRSK